MGLLARFLIVASVLLSFGTYSQNYLHDLDLPIRKGVRVKVVDYTAKAGGIYEVISMDYPGEGYSYTRFAYLKDAASKYFGETRVKRKDLVGRIFILSRDLKTLKVDID